MNCPKCCSLMFQSYPVKYHANLTDASESVHNPSWWCIMCGTYIDNTILANKEAQRLAAV